MKRSKLFDRTSRLFVIFVLGCSFARPTIAGDEPISSGLAVWFKADAGVSDIGGSVTGWTDQSLTGFTVVPPVLQAPTLVTDVVNGLPALRFDGNDRLIGALGQTLNDTTVFALARYNVAESDIDYLYTIGASVFSGSQMTLSRRNGDAAYHFDGGMINIGPGTIPANEFVVLSQVYGRDGAEKHVMYRNAATLMQTAAGSPYAANANTFVIGNWSSVPHPFQGDLVEMLVYDRALDFVEQRAVEEYLRGRAGLSPFFDLSAVDLSTWSVVQYEFNAQPDAEWTLDLGNTKLDQVVNCDPSIYLSDFDVINTEITGTLGAGGEPDYMGFVFGYQDRGRYYLFDWKKVTAPHQNFGVGDAGMTLRVVDTGGGDPTGTDLWGSADTANTTTLRDNDIPWVNGEVYTFRIVHRPGQIDIEIRDDLDVVIESWNVQDSTYVSGKFGYYVNSLQGVEFGTTKVDPVTPVAALYGTGCPGSEGVIPALFVTGDPTPGGQIQVTVQGGLGGASAFLLLGLDQAATPFGPYGCSLNVTPLLGVFGPFPLAGSVPGSGCLNLPATLDPTLPAGATVTLQAYVLDSGVPGGQSSTNGAELTIL